MNIFFSLINRMAILKLFSAWLLCAVVSACASPHAATPARLAALLPTDVLLLGEQHDAPEHQQIHQQVIALLAQRGLLAAVALEMADTGVSTAQLPPDSNEQQVKKALNWNDKGWPWQAYGPAVMAAVQAGIRVVGANLPRESMRASMADSTLDGQLPASAFKAQQQQIRVGHCNTLPDSQITPMTRIQIAKDIKMAETLKGATWPGKVVVLLAGSGHADRLLGVPQHLPAGLKVKAIRLRPASAAEASQAEAFDAVWVTPALPDKDYCATLKMQMAK